MMHASAPAAGLCMKSTRAAPAWRGVERCPGEAQLRTVPLRTDQLALPEAKGELHPPRHGLRRGLSRGINAGQALRPLQPRAASQPKQCGSAATSNPGIECKGA